MTQRYSAFILLVTSLLSTSMAAGKEDNIMNKEEAKVTETLEKMTSAFNEKDIAGVLASYENGAAVIFEPGKKVTDPVILKQMFEGAFQLDPRFSYPNGHEVTISNDIALHIAPWVMEGKSPDGADIKHSGLSVAVLRKQENGTWLQVLDNPHGQLLMEK